MDVLKNIIRARTQRELEKRIAYSQERGWKVASHVKYFPGDRRPYQVLLEFDEQRSESYEKRQCAFFQNQNS